MTDKAPVKFSQSKGIEPVDMDQVYRFCNEMQKTSLSKKWRSVADMALAIFHAAPLGFSPPRALQDLAVINGKVTIPGEPGLGLVRRAGVMKSYSKIYVGDPYKDDYACRITTERKDIPGANATEFSVLDAKEAHLWGKQGPWTEYKKRMLYFRALGFHLSDYYSDVMMGIGITEAAEDRQPARQSDIIVTTIEEVKPEKDPLLTELKLVDDGISVVAEAVVVEEPKPKKTRKKNNAPPDMTTLEKLIVKVSEKNDKSLQSAGCDVDEASDDRYGVQAKTLTDPQLHEISRIVGVHL